MLQAYLNSGSLIIGGRPPPPEFVILCTYSPLSCASTMDIQLLMPTSIYSIFYLLSLGFYRFAKKFELLGYTFFSIFFFYLSVFSPDLKIKTSILLRLFFCFEVVFFFQYNEFSRSDLKKKHANFDRWLFGGIVEMDRLNWWESDDLMKTAVFGRDSSVEAGSPCGAPPSLTFTPPANLVPPTTLHHNRTSRAGISASSAQVVRHTRRTSRMQNVGGVFDNSQNLLRGELKFKHENHPKIIVEHHIKLLS